MADGKSPEVGQASGGIKNRLKPVVNAVNRGLVAVGLITTGAKAIDYHKNPHEAVGDVQSYTRVLDRGVVSSFSRFSDVLPEISDFFSKQPYNGPKNLEIERISEEVDKIVDFYYPRASLNDKKELRTQVLVMH